MVPNQQVLYVLAGIVGVLVILALIAGGIVFILLRKLRKHDQELREFEAKENPPPPPPQPPTEEELAETRAAAERLRAANRERVAAVRQRARESGQRLRGTFTVTRTTTSSLPAGFEGLTDGLREMSRAMGDLMNTGFPSLEEAARNLQATFTPDHTDRMFEEVSEIMSRAHALTPDDIAVLHRHFPRLNFGNAPRVAAPDPKAELERRAIPPPPPKPNPTWHEHLLRDEDEEPECPPTIATSQPTQVRQKPPPTPAPTDGKKTTS